MKHIYLFIAFVFFLTSCQEQVITDDDFQDEILYYSSRKGIFDTWQIYRKDLQTNTVQSITDDSDFNYWWVIASPDKTQLLLLRSPSSSSVDQFDYPNCEMIKCNSDGSNLEVIIEDDENDWFAFGNPHWHPDGGRILMIAQSDNEMAPYFTYTVDEDGNDPQLLIDQYSIDANWNKEGDKVTFIGVDSAGFVDLTSLEVFVSDYDYDMNQVSSIVQLTSDDTRNHDPCFSPDGMHIAFSASDGSLTSADLVRIDFNGENRTDLINDEGIHGGPLNWGEDGKLYHHSIYLGTSNFTADTYNPDSETKEILLESISEGFISPYYLRM